VTTIAHISDLHLYDGTDPKEWKESWQQRVIGFLEQEKGLKLEIGAHDQNRLDALKGTLLELKPDVLVCTGDLSTYGDAKSLEFGRKFLRDIANELSKSRGDSNQAQVLVVPGNHDALQERFAMLRKHANWLGRGILEALERFHKDLRVIAEKGDPSSPSRVHLGNYLKEVAEPSRCATDPGKPFVVKTLWGQIRFYLFNSVNDPGWMANEGRIGAHQYNQLSSTLREERKQEESGEMPANIMRVALLHHHPLPIPYSPDTTYERFYNSMQDGSTLCDFLNKHRFQLALHGHEHQPYNCEVRYSANSPLHVIAAGTATQADAEGDKASFNLLRVISPFEVNLKRVLYRPDTGFDLGGPETPLRFTPQVSSRFTPGTVDEQDFFNFLRPNELSMEADHSIELLSLTAQVGLDCVYRAAYQIKGTCLRAGSPGVVQTITGSPERQWAELKVRAFPTANPAARVGCKLLNDHPRQKTFLLQHSQPANLGHPFDYTYEFQWENAAPDKTYFDGINLYRYQAPIGNVNYQIDLSWDPPQREVEKAGLRTFTHQVDISRRELAGQQTGAKYRFSFELENPEMIAYLIHLPKDS
jgi:predicted phosphodiesterase